MQSVETMTPTEALLWLAELEKKCPLTEGAVSFPFCESHCTCEHHKPWRCKVCAGTGKAPVLDLREPCTYNRRHEPGPYYTALSPSCHKCQGREWLPKQGRDALFEAMHKAGWDWEASQQARDTAAWTRFEKYLDTMMVPDRDILLAHGEYRDPWLAAVSAMKAAGYLV